MGCGAAGERASSWNKGQRSRAKGHDAVPLKLSDRKQAATCKSGEEDSK